MITDGSEIESSTPLPCDVLIVGAGPAGIVVARDLAVRGRRVVLLDGGGVSVPHHVGALPGSGVTEGVGRAEQDIYRDTGVGGTTSRWGGFCLPYDRSALHARPRLNLPEWPIAADALQPFEARAVEHLNLSPFDDVCGKSFGRSGAVFRDDALELHHLQFSPTDYLKEKAYAEFKSSKNVTLVENVFVDRLLFDDGRGTIEFVEGVCRDKRRVRFAPRHVVLASGCIEATRLLMSQTASHANGIGNGGGHLGKHLMSHLEGLVPIDIHPGSVLYGHDAIQSYAGLRPFVDVVKVSRGVVERESLMNCHGWLHRPILTDPDHNSGAYSALYLAKWLRKRLFNIEQDRSDEHFVGRSLSARDYVKHVANIVSHPDDVVRTLILERRNELGVRRPFVMRRKFAGRLSLKWNSEQEPTEQSYIRLHSEKDALGNPLAEVRWAPSAADKHTVRRHLELIGGAFARCGVGTFAVPPEEVDHVAVGGHYIGTTRMAESERDGVVDPDCKVFSTRNLYVAASSVFPTSDSANPTFMLVAVAARLAERLNKLLDV